MVLLDHDDSVRYKCIRIPSRYVLHDSLYEGPSELIPGSSSVKIVDVHYIPFIPRTDALVAVTVLTGVVVPSA